MRSGTFLLTVGDHGIEDLGLLLFRNGWALISNRECHFTPQSGTEMSATVFRQGNLNGGSRTMKGDGIVDEFVE